MKRRRWREGGPRRSTTGGARSTVRLVGAVGALVGLGAVGGRDLVGGIVGYGGGGLRLLEGCLVLEARDGRLARGAVLVGVVDLLLGAAVRKGPLNNRVAVPGLDFADVAGVLAGENNAVLPAEVGLNETGLLLLAPRLLLNVTAPEGVKARELLQRLDGANVLGDDVTLCLSAAEVVPNSPP